jgi:hypothetical protein
MLPFKNTISQLLVYPTFVLVSGLASTAIAHATPKLQAPIEHFSQAKLETVMLKGKPSLKTDSFTRATKKFIPKVEALYQETTSSGEIKLSTANNSLSVPCGIHQKTGPYETIGLITVNKKKPTKSTLKRAATLCASLAVESIKDKASQNQTVENYRNTFAIGKYPNTTHNPTFWSVAKTGRFAKPVVETPPLTAEPRQKRKPDHKSPLSNFTEDSAGHDDSNTTIPIVQPTATKRITGSGNKPLLMALNGQRSFACVKGTFTGDLRRILNNNPQPLSQFKTLALYTPQNGLSDYQKELYVEGAMASCGKIAILTKNKQAFGIVPQALIHPLKGKLSAPALAYTIQNGDMTTQNRQ